MAVSLRDGWVRLTETERSIATGQLTTGEGLSWGRALRTRRVPCRSLDSLLRTNDPPDFVKIDVEGHEVAVVAGGCELFTRVRPKVLIEVHRAEFGQRIRRMLPGYDLVELRHEPPVHRGSFTWHNHFWLTGSTYA